MFSVHWKLLTSLDEMLGGLAILSRPAGLRGPGTACWIAPKIALTVRSDHGADFRVSCSGDQGVGLLGHDCRTAASAADALAVVETPEPELALLDIGLPDLSGYEPLGALRARLALRVPYFAALTGWPEARTKALAAGFESREADVRVIDLGHAGGRHRGDRRRCAR